MRGPTGAATSGNAVEIIFDASGSMLQKIGGKRRIDIARETLTKLTSQVIPAGTPFAMRVFGREVNSCQTDMFIPVSPLNAATVGGQIAKLEAKERREDTHRGVACKSDGRPGIRQRRAARRAAHRR